MKSLHVLMPDGAIRNFTTLSPAIDAALRQGGTAVTVEGNAVTHQFSQRQFQGGWLLDNCPINVVMGMGWIPGQVEALQAAGISCGIAADVATVSDPACPYGYAENNGGCDRDWDNVSADDLRNYLQRTGGGTITPVVDDEGNTVTLQTQTSVTPHVPIPSSGAAYGGSDGVTPFTGGGGGGSEGDGVSSYFPLIAIGAIAFMLMRGK